MSIKNSLFKTVSTVIVILALTTALFLYTSGYRIEKGTEEIVDLTKTGMVSAKSIPEGASVYIDDKLTTATNDTVSGIEPGIHKLTIVKKGFEQWSKEVEVFEELVTDITSVLISQSPLFEPLTNTGASFPSVSPSLKKLAYFSKDEESPGVWLIPIDQGGLNIFRANPTVVLEDTRVNKYSEGKSITWSPDENQLLVETQDGLFYLVDLKTSTAQSTTDINSIKETWEIKLKEKRLDFVTKLDIPENIKTLATTNEVLWSPDEKKFLFITQEGDKLSYKVYNMEKPLPVGEKVETTVLEIPLADIQPVITWYADSYHLLLTQGQIAEQRNGTISLVRIDGTNKVEIYGGSLHSPNVYSTPAGDKIIILTTFKSGDKTDLYTVGIR